MAKTNNLSQEFLTTSELAEIIGVSRVAIYKRIKKGDIEAIRIGRNYVIPKHYVSEVYKRKITAARKKLIEKAVRKVVKEYGDVLKKLGQE
ncbi:MAG: helix-turn-helix domain-containing protein [Deltaproteobacteria bacterium]|nr:helix-turn-helix domain-containing protein [Deltaproteobacteria bacterium]